jgi:hypothetical protein
MKLAGLADAVLFLLAVTFYRILTLLVISPKTTPCNQCPLERVLGGRFYKNKNHIRFHIKNIFDLNPAIVWLIKLNKPY